MQRGVHELTATEQAWAAQQVAAIIGATPDDAAPLAAFLSGIGDANELQSQLLDMLGESPPALDFGLALIAKRFPVALVSPPLPPRPPPGAAATGAGSSSSAGGGQEAAKSQRQIKRERQQRVREQREAEERRRRLANRKRARCECQAATHALFTNCLACGRIICESEGPGPCMFCGNEVESPDQQLLQHMRRRLARPAPPPAPQRPAAGSGGSYRRMAGGVDRPQLLWSETEPTPADSSASSTTCVAEEASEEEWMGRAFRALGVSRAAATEDEVRAAEAWAAAARRKDRLLGFDRTAAQRTRLIDEAADFDPDAVHKWMSADERTAANRRRSERAEAEAEREARLRRGVRVLRLNLAGGSAELNREAACDNEAGPAPPAPTQKHPQPQPQPQPQSQPAPQPAAPTFVLAAAKKAQRAARKGAANDAAAVGAQSAEHRRRQLRIQPDDATDAPGL
ncbi:hypothetical protein H4R21_002365 [Coemansia helicoidea]|uniref:Uncharacterized protein n=1 Tax=Coemansia helicoidea TaxID=1286919 RepID=A0ACC1L6U1_9FUNG|nr:hypothetical protein H4R21_002365 [Coemansia helicoidea]